MPAAIWYDRDGYRTDGAKLMGRHAAGEGFLDALIRFGSADRLVGIVRTRDASDAFVETVQRLRPDLPASTATMQQPRALRDVGCLYMPQPLSAKDAWFRHIHGPQAWSLCGVTHTIASAAIMDAVTSWPTAPFQTWDAVVCTSQAVQTALRRLLESQVAFLSERLGATRFPVPSLPVIPLGVDCEARRATPEDRAEARKSLGLDPEATAILFLGRLSFHAKANPAPMYLALERLAKQHKVVLVECGYAGNAHISAAFEQGRAVLCPSVRHVGLDGRDAEQRRIAWAVADIFCSLSDNIQESFGMTPIEAMAAGLPSVVTDWNGYRETVRDGVDGFLVPTCGPPAGAGPDLAFAHATGLDDYDMYVAQSALAAAVDIDRVAASLERLVLDKDLRRQMGEHAAGRARDVFDWRHIVQAYEALWDELALQRAAAKAPSPRASGWPARPDPFALFAHYPSGHLASTTVLRLRPEADAQTFEARLKLTLATINRRSLSMAALHRLRAALEQPGMTVQKLVPAFPEISPLLVYRSAIQLMKFGLVEIDPSAGSLGENESAET